jgi:hypothetical protein
MSVETMDGGIDSERVQPASGPAAVPQFARAEADQQRSFTSRPSPAQKRGSPAYAPASG